MKPHTSIAWAKVAEKLIKELIPKTKVLAATAIVKEYTVKSESSQFKEAAPIKRQR